MVTEERRTCVEQFRARVCAWSLQRPDVVAVPLDAHRPRPVRHVLPEPRLLEEPAEPHVVVGTHADGPGSLERGRTGAPLRWYPPRRGPARSVRASPGPSLSRAERTHAAEPVNGHREPGR